MEQIEVLAHDAPGRAGAVIAEFGRLGSGIPALHDPVETLRHVLRDVALEPLGLDEAAAQGRGRLLILAGEGVPAHRSFQRFEEIPRFTLGLQGLTLASLENLRARRYRVMVHLVLVSDRWEPHDLPLLPLEQMARQA